MVLLPWPYQGLLCCELQSVIIQVMRNTVLCHHWCAGGQETGWDVFALHYEVGAPLCSFFTATAMESYSRVSKLLWRLRRSERALCMAWRTLKVGIGMRKDTSKRGGTGQDVCPSQA